MSRRIDSRRRTARVIVPLAVSLIVHFAVLLLAQWRAPRPQPAGPGRTVTEIEIYEIAPRSQPPSAKAPLPSKSVGVPKRSRRPGSEREKSGEAKPDTTARGENAIEELRGSDVPKVAPDAGMAADLQHLPPSVLGPISPLPKEPTIDGLSGLHAPAIPKDIVAATVTGVLGSKRAESGNVAPYFSKLQDVLTDSWKINQREKKNLQPTSVRLTQARSGQLVSAELISSSSDAAWDRGLLHDLKQASARLPEPPPEVFSGHGHLSTQWSFQYLPRALTDFDIVDLFDKRAIPKSRGKRVQLLSIEPTD